MSKYDDDDQDGSLLGGAKSDLGYGNDAGSFDLPSTMLTGDGIAVPGSSAAAPGIGLGASASAMAIGEESQAGAMPRILLLGLKRSGKSSILKVVFNKMSPHETRHLESTKTPEKCCKFSLSSFSFFFSYPVFFMIWLFLPLVFVFTSSQRFQQTHSSSLMFGIILDSWTGSLNLT